MVEITPIDEAMRQVNLGLAYETDYSAILDGALTQMTRSLGASDAAVLRYEPETRSLRRICIIRNCEPAVSQPDHPLVDCSRSMDVDAMPLWNRLGPGEVHVSHPDTEGFDPLLPETVDNWHKLRRHKLCLRSPLTIGNERVGWIGVSFLEAVPAVDPILETFRVLSQQITLVLLLLQLSETAKYNATRVAVTEERNRIARDVHDTLAHSFTGILLQLEAAKEFMKTRPDVVETCIDKASIAAREGLQQSRQAVMNLQENRPEALVKAIPDLISKAEADRNAHAHFEVRGVARALPAEANRQMFRICQEAFTNALLHSGAANIFIVLDFTTASVLLTIRDDGKGFSPAQASDIGFGLSGMRKRAERIGTVLNIESSGKAGTTIWLDWREANGA